MIKLMLFVKRRPDLSAEAFRDRYESGHVKLAIEQLPRLRKYARNYLTPKRGQTQMDFDCITEFWFDDWDAWRETSAFVMSEQGQVLAQDEAVFMDRDSMRYSLVEEHVTDVEAARASAVNP